jgi:large subunit ribosomal protein L7/L12
MSKKIENIISEMKSLTVVDFLQLIEDLKKEFNISPEMLTMGSGSSSNNVATEPAEDVNKKVSVVLKDLGGASPLGYIKATKEALGLTVEVAKGHTTKVAAGETVVIKEGLLKKEAEDLIKKITSITPGLSLEIK